MRTEVTPTRHAALQKLSGTELQNPKNWVAVVACVTYVPVTGDSNRLQICWSLATVYSVFKDCHSPVLAAAASAQHAAKEL